MTDSSQASTASQAAGRRIRELRERQGWSQAQLAQRLPDDLHLHQTQLSKIERGERELTWAEAVGITEALGGSVTRLLEDVPDDDMMVVQLTEVISHLQDTIKHLRRQQQ